MEYLDALCFDQALLPGVTESEVKATPGGGRWMLRQAANEVVLWT